MLILFSEDISDISSDEGQTTAVGKSPAVEGPVDGGSDTGKREKRKKSSKEQGRTRSVVEKVASNDGEDSEPRVPSHSERPQLESDSEEDEQGDGAGRKMGSSVSVVKVGPGKLTHHNFV